MKPASRQPCTGLICNKVEEGYSEDGDSLVEAARQKKTAPSEKEDVQAGSGADHSSGNGKSKGNSGHKRMLFICSKSDPSIDIWNFQLFKGSQGEEMV